LYGVGLIANEIVAQVLERCDIVELIGGYTPLKRAGRNFKALCPFHHEKTSSFVVSPDKQIYHCFGCGAGGNAIGFIMHQERLEFPEAVRFLADKVGIVIPETSTGGGQAGQLRQEVLKLNAEAAEFFHENLLKSHDIPVQKARDYLKGRGIRLEDVKQFKLGFAPDSWDSLLNFFKSKNVPLKTLERSGLINPREKGDGYYDRFRDRIIFPIFDAKSQCIGFGARTMKADEPGAKYINSPDTPAYTKGNNLFGLNLTRNAITKKDFVIVVEGYMDMIIPYQYGIDNIVASLGTALTTEQIRLLRRYTTNVVMLFDADKAGQAAIVRSLDLLTEQDMNVKVAKLATDEDPDSFIRKFGVDKFHEHIRDAQTLFDFKFQWLTQQFDPKNIEQRAQICDQMLVTINKIKNEVVKYGYIRQLAERLGLPEHIVLKEGKKFEPAPAKDKPVQQPRLKPLSQTISPVERHVLELLLHNAQLIAKAKTQLSASDFEDPRVKVIMEKLFEVSQEQESFSTASFLNYFSDPEIQAVILNISATEPSAGQQTARILDDCITRIKKDRLKARRQNLSQLIREAETAGDRDRVKELMEEYNQLIKTS
jgi:DNA primase